MIKDHLLKEIHTIQDFFNHSTNCLTEKDSSFSPSKGSLSVAQQVAHVTQSIDWFVDALTSPNGFDMDFEAHWKDVSHIRHSLLLENGS